MVRSNGRKETQMSDQGDTNPYSSQGTAYTSPALPSDPQYGRPMKFSRLGIWSFVLSLASIFGLFALVIFAGIVSINNPEIENNESHPLLIFIGLTVIGMGFVGFASFIMAVISLFMPNRKKLFGILAVMSSLIFIAAIGLLFTIGLRG